MSAGYAGPNGATLRVSDAEREATAAELREHYAAGRLTTEELNDRLDRTFAAKTRAELSAVMPDLPNLRPGTAPLHSTGQPSTEAGWNGSSGYSSGHRDWGGQGGDGDPGWGPRRTVGSVFSLLAAFCVLATFGMIAAFSVGGGRPFGVALLIAAFALLRRLFFRRRGARSQRAKTSRGRGRRRF